MQTIDEMTSFLKEKLDFKRFKHSLGVKSKAEELAQLYGVSVKKAGIAGLLHDCAKNYDEEQLFNLALRFNIPLDKVIKHNLQLLHGQIGTIIARDKLGVKDRDILNAIKYHTTGREKMSKLEKIIFLSDFIEPGRNFQGVDQLRREALFDLNKATLMALDHTIHYVIKKRAPLHPFTIYARNYLLFSNLNENKL